MSVITRFAPSPTGYFHAGSYRTALFACIFARQNNGKFILRIEDTDKIRSKKEYEENIIESLEWMGLKYDEIYKQSDRTEIYKNSIKKLIDSGHAYISDETKKVDEVDGNTYPKSSKSSSTLPSVIRFKNPNKKVTFTDLIRGEVSFDTTELGDFVIAKNENEPVFHLAVVVDDNDSGVTHVIRGEDHISNTPRQILIYEALGATLPQYAHIPLLLASDKSKLSKRNGAIPVTEYKQRGIMPEALVNYLTLLGWHPTDDREILTFDEILKEFSLERVQKGGAIFDDQKLSWFNHQYIQKLNDEEFLHRASAFMPEWLAKNDSRVRKLVPIIKKKINIFSEIEKLFLSGGDLAFVRTIQDYSTDRLLWKKNPDPIKALEHLEYIINEWNKIDELSFNAENLKIAIWSRALTVGKGDVLWPLRMALTGQERSPDPFISADILGKETSLVRIEKAITLLKDSA